MKALCVSTFSTFYTDFSLMYDILDRMREYQVGVDFWLVNSEEEYFAQIRREAQGRLAPFYKTLHSTAKTTELTSAIGSDMWKQTMSVYQKNFDLYREIGAHSITIHTNQRVILPEEAQQLRCNCQENSLFLAKLAEEQGLTLMLENVGPVSQQKNLYDQEAFIRLFDQLPASVYCLIDIGHALMNGWNIEEVIDRLGDRIRGYHLNSNDGVRDVDAHRPVFNELHSYDKAGWQRLLRLMDEKAPNAEWILEYRSGEHITAPYMEQEILQIMDCVNQ